MSSPFVEPANKQAASGTELCIILGDVLQGEFGITVDTDPLDTEGLPDKVVRRPAGELNKPYFFLTWQSRATQTKGFGLPKRTFRRKTYQFLLRGFQLIQGVDSDGNSFDQLLEDVADYLACRLRTKARCTVLEEPSPKSMGVRRSPGDPPIRYHLGEVNFQAVTHDHLILPDQGE